MQSPSADGGQWNGRKVADWLAQLIGRPVARQRGWEDLKQMRYRLRVPRLEHDEAAPQVQAEWKKNLELQVQQIQTKHPDCDVEVWTMDKHRAGLKSVIQRIWMDEWTTPVAQVKWRLSGCGCMPLFRLNLGRPSGGFCRMSTTIYVAGF